MSERDTMTVKIESEPLEGGLVFGVCELCQEAAATVLVSQARQGRSGSWTILTWECCEDCAPEFMVNLRAWAAETAES